MAKYQEIQYHTVITQLIRMRQIRGSPIPLTSTVKALEKQLGVMMDIPRIKRGLVSIGHHVEVHKIQDNGVMKVIDVIT